MVNSLQVGASFFGAQGSGIQRSWKMLACNKVQRFPWSGHMNHAGREGGGREGGEEGWEGEGGRRSKEGEGEVGGRRRGGGGEMGGGELAHET